MGANQSGEVVGTTSNLPASKNPRNQPKPGAKTRLTYQESFDIRSRAADAFVPKIYRRNERKSSLSSSSGSGSPTSSRPVSRSTSRALKRNKSNIKPPIFLFSGGRTKGWENYNNNGWGGGSGSHWATRKTSSGAESDLSGKFVNNRFGGPDIARNSKLEQQQQNQPQVSFDTDSDIEQEIDMILNDTSNGNEPWYHNHDKGDSVCGSSSTVAMEIKGKDEDNQDTLDEEDLNSTRSLPTPSHYLYLTFDEDDDDLGDDADKKPHNLDNKKSKSIEFLDGPSYFFLNYNEENSLPDDRENDPIPYTENTNDTTEAISDLPFDEIPSSNSPASLSK